jgi:hypothetical protein
MADTRNGERVDVQRQVGGLPGERGHHLVDHATGQGEAGEHHRSDRRRPIGDDQAELVGRLEAVARHQVRHGGLFGRHPEQADDLDQDRGDEQPPQRAHQRNRAEQHETQDVAVDESPPPVEPVGNNAGKRAEQDGGREPQDEDAETASSLPDVPVASAPASEVVASRPSQSPKLESPRASQSRRNGTIASTARTS